MEKMFVYDHLDYKLGGGGGDCLAKNRGFLSVHPGFLPQGMLQAGLGLAPNYQ